MISMHFVYGFCAGFFVAELLIVWILRAPLRPRAPNAEPAVEVERWTYTIVDDGAIYVGEMTRPSEHALITAIAHRHNTPNARN